MWPGSRALVISAVALLGALPTVIGHSDGNTDMDTMGSMPGNHTSAEQPPNYFRHPHYAGWMYAHIALMICGWIFALPPAIMLSVSRSRFHLPAQVFFHLLNGLGVLTGFVYNHATPDLYKRNSHHPIGWVVTSSTIVWTALSIFVAYNAQKNNRKEAASHSMTAQNLAQYDQSSPYEAYSDLRSSRDSGQGTERNTDSNFSSRQHSQDAIRHKPAEPNPHMHDEDLNDDQDSDEEKRGLLGDNRVDRFISRHVGRFASPKAGKIMRISQIVLEKLLLLLGFLALTTGFVAYGGVFRCRAVFSGAAHFFKGGIFFWYGVVTLSRWMGAFQEFGWAWNIRPGHPLVARWKSRVPSAEFVESFVIWTYGASNVFMEHMNNWGKAWSNQDLEHVSITLLFFGGGLLGMLIESSWAREMMNTTALVQKKEAGEVGGRSSTSRLQHASAAVEEPDDLWEQPKTYKTSLNPVPGLVIMLLGIMMSGHHQSSMVSTMMHAQWGTLFVGFAMARAATYILLYLKPPASHFPARPPTELVAAFCLTAGGLLFMVSARDTVQTIEMNKLDAMSIYTVTLGLAAAILAWEVVVFSIKGWAVRKERAAADMTLA